MVWLCNFALCLLLIHQNEVKNNIADLSTRQHIWVFLTVLVSIHHPLTLTLPPPHSKMMQPVIIVEDNRNSMPQKKRARTESKNGNNSRCVLSSILRPESSSLLDDMLYPLTTDTFLQDHFRKDAVCINRKSNAQDPQESRSSTTTSQ